VTKTICLTICLTIALVGALGAVAHAGDATVPDCVGLPLTEAQALLAKAGFEVAVKPAPGRPLGVVFSQSPGGLATRATGSTVELQVGGPTNKPGMDLPKIGPKPKPEPKPDDGPPAGTRGDGPISKPADDLGAPPAGAGAVPVDPVPSTPVPTRGDTPPSGTDTSGSSQGGVRAAPGSSALVYEGKAIPPGSLPATQGPALPDVLNQPAARARRMLGRWKVKVEQSLALPELVGRVINQVPPAGMTLAQGEAVTIVIAVSSSANDAIFVPQALGKDWHQACAALRAAGVTPAPRSVPSSEAQRGQVLMQSPQPSSLVSPGAAITLMVGRGSGAYSADVVAGPAPEPRPEPKPEPRPEPTPEPTPEPKPVDPVDEGPPAGSGTTPIEPGPEPKPEPRPEPTPEPKPEPKPEPTPEPKPEPKPVVPQLAAPTLKSPPAGESYPYKYGADFSWSKIENATGYELELQEEQPSGSWATVSTEMVVAPKYRPSKLKRGRYRWRVRATGAEAAQGKWSDFRRLYMY